MHLDEYIRPRATRQVMGFIDENCAVFDTEEENKLSYTTLHHQFKELVRALVGVRLSPTTALPHYIV